MEKELWNYGEDRKYSTDTELYKNHILEQYKLYVEMADRISARRNLANVFFLTLNTSILGAIGLNLKTLLALEYYALLTLLIVIPMSITCVIWWWLIRSYRQLNGAKYKVIGEMEKRLPANSYAAEWKQLGEGKSLKQYLPLTHLEKFVPIVFVLLYLVAAIFINFLL